jgi:hypothetical protein
MSWSTIRDLDSPDQFVCRNGVGTDRASCEASGGTWHADLDKDNDVLAITDLDESLINPRTFKITPTEWSVLAGVDFKVFQGATSTNAGTAGLVPAPVKTYDLKWEISTSSNPKGYNFTPQAKNSYTSQYSGVNPFIFVEVGDSIEIVNNSESEHPFFIVSGVNKDSANALGTKTGSTTTFTFIADGEYTYFSSNDLNDHYGTIICRIAGSNYYLMGDCSWRVPPYPPYVKGASSTTNGARGLVPAPAAQENDEFLRGDGTFTLTPYPLVFKGATSGAAGTAGLVPAPSNGDEDYFLDGSGQWVASKTFDVFATTVTGTDGLVPAVTNSQKTATGTSSNFLKASGSWGSVPYPSTVTTSAAGLIAKSTTGKFLRGDNTWTSTPYPPIAGSTTAGIVRPDDSTIKFNANDSSKIDRKSGLRRYYVDGTCLKWANDA